MFAAPIECLQHRSRSNAIRAYQYQSDTPTNKATIEHIYKPDYGSVEGEGLHGPTVSFSFTFLMKSSFDDVDGDQGGSPWKMGWQMHERNLVWSSELKLRLIKKIASDECGIDEADMDNRLSLLANLLPGLEQKLSSAPPTLVAKLAADPQRVAVRLMKLKEIFPDADLSKMVSGRISLLLDDDLSLEAISDAAMTLRETLPSIKTDVFASLFPQVLDAGDFIRAVEDFKRIMPDRDLALQLRSEPDLILQLMKGKNLIPYDQVSNPFVEGKPQSIN